MKKLAIAGGGAWGTALSIVLAPRMQRVRLWVHDPEVCQSVRRHRENRIYLPGFALPDRVEPTSRLEEALDGADLILAVTPSAHLREVFRQVRTSTPIVSAVKGIENGTLLPMSQVLAECVPDAPVAVLSGPTFAREIARGDPAAVVIASRDPALVSTVQAALSGPSFRLYAQSDVTGVELGGALKNVIAIGAGICAGLGLGGNSTAALVTRGLAEITRLAVAMGGSERTLAGLAGLGDLVLTCTGQLSRNRSLGLELATGRKLERILESSRTVAEGVNTTFAAVELADRYSVPMPIARQMFQILRHGKDPREGVRELMERELKAEIQ